MADVVFKIFERTMYDDMERLRKFTDDLCRAVNFVHYGSSELMPGDITLDVPPRDHDLSRSDAHFELHISEGSENWPTGEDRDEGETTHDAVRKVLGKRGEDISRTIIDAGYGDWSHNIFEVTGHGTGWYQYKPGVASTEA